MNTNELPAPSFRLTWKADKAAYYVDRPNIDSTDCYTPDAVRAILADRERQAGEAVAWEGCEGWEPLAWELCADESGEESCNELIWEGGPVPEPWGERWLKYEDEAKRLIKLVHKHSSLPAHQAVQADSRALALLRESRNTLFMWRDVAPAVSLLDDIDRFLAAAPSPDGKAEQPYCWRCANYGHTSEECWSAPKAEQVEALSYVPCPTCGANTASDNPAHWCACPKPPAIPAAEFVQAEAAGDHLSQWGDEIALRMAELRRHMQLGLTMPVMAEWNWLSNLHSRMVGTVATQPTASNASTVLMPKRMTQAMRDVIDTEGWAWEDLLAAAEAITEAEYAEIAASPTASNAEREALKDLLYAHHARPSCQEGASHITRCRCASCATERASAALASKPPAGEQKPVAVLRFERGTPGRENDMPRVVSCDWQRDGEYPVYLGPQPEQVAHDREHAENYRLIRRGQHWSVVDGIGNTLRGEDLDAAVDAIRASRARGEAQS